MNKTCFVNSVKWNRFSNLKTPTFKFRKTVNIYMKNVYTFPVPYIILQLINNIDNRLLRIFLSVHIVGKKKRRRKVRREKNLESVKGFQCKKN